MNKHKKQRAFNVLGKSFLIDIDELNRYPTTLLANVDQLQPYWHSSLNAYFFSRDPFIFEHVILPFYSSSHLSNIIKRSSMIWLPEKIFQEELCFYNLIEYYQRNDIADILFEYHPQSSEIISLLKSLLIRKCLCRLIFDLIACVSCGIGLGEMILWRYHHRLTSLLIGDILMSLLLLWTLFYEQYADRLLIKMKFYFNNNLENEQKKSMNTKLYILSSYQSLVFILLMIVASLPFIVTLLSFKNKNAWYFTMALAFRHLLLICLCSPDVCHWIDILYYSGRYSFRVLSYLFLFFITIIFVCIWIGISIYITDSNAIINYKDKILAPSRYVYFIYQIILNVGYGDTKEQSILSLIMIIIMTLLASPLLIIIYQNFIEELNYLKIKMNHIETWHHTYFINYLTHQLNKYHQSKVNIETNVNNSNIN